MVKELYFFSAVIHLEIIYINFILSRTLQVKVKVQTKSVK